MPMVCTSNEGTLAKDCHVHCCLLPRSLSGHRYVLVIFDNATRYLEAVPMKSTEVERVVKEC